MFQLFDVDIDGVHLVGEPANRRPFAVIKSLTAGKPDPTGGADKMNFLDELKKALEAGDLKVDGDLVELLGKDAIAKALGVEIPEPEPKIEKAELPDNVKAYVEALEKKLGDATDAIDTIVKAREADEKAALQKRVEVLKSTGLELDGETVTEAEVAALEKASAFFDARLEKMGVLRIKGEPKSDDREDSALSLVRKEVSRRLGREPVNKAEEAKIRREVYREYPGLLKAVTQEERASA